MVEQNTAQLDSIFHALADPSRRAILSRLAEAPLTVGAVAEPFGMSLAAVSKHLGVLENAGLVERKADGRRRLCQLTAQPMAGASAWLQQYARFWSDRLDALEAAIREDME